MVEKFQGFLSGGFWVTGCQVRDTHNTFERDTHNASDDCGSLMCDEVCANLSVCKH